MITISNNHQAITATNYWDSAHAKRGLYFASWNAGALRLLVPDNQVAEITEMRTGPRCIVTRGKLNGVDCLELMWDDGSDSPYCIHLDMRQTDRAIESEPAAMVVTAWTRNGLAATWPGRYRVTATLPCLLPWVEH